MPAPSRLWCNMERFLDWFFHAPVRLYAMIGAMVVMTGVLIWWLINVRDAVTPDLMNRLPAQYIFDLYKWVIDGQIIVAIIMAILLGLGMVALSSTRFSATSKLGSITVDGDEIEPPPPASIVKTVTTVETKNDDPSA